MIRKESRFQRQRQRVIAKTVLRSIPVASWISAFHKSAAAFLIVSIFVGRASPSLAQVVVQKSAYATMTSLPPFTGEPSLAVNATKILSSDLDRSGWFKIVAAGAGEINIVGVATRSGDGFSLDVRIYSRGGSVTAGSQTTAGSGGQIYGKKFPGNSSGELRQVVHALADDIVTSVAKQKGIAQTKIAFISNRTGRKEVYLMDYDGYNIRQVPSDGSISARPRWSADRRYLAYLSYKSRGPAVYTIEVASGRRNRVAAYPGL